MPGDPRECREHARHCAEIAASASTPLVRENFLALAETWSRLARDLETSKALLESWGDAGPMVRSSERQRVAQGRFAIG